MLFVIALKAMSSYKTARMGNLLGAIGMAMAIAATLLTRAPGQQSLIITQSGWIMVAIGILCGAVIGAVMAMTVRMTGMPQMVAIFNGFGGLASALVVMANIWQMPELALASQRQTVIAVAVTSVIGWVTFTGSLVAFAKLQEFILSGRPVIFKFHKLLNFVGLAAAVALVVIMGISPESRWLVIPLAIIASCIGIGFTIPIGGADMPVVISLLNSYSGLAACSAGFVLGNSGLIIAGSLVGASGIVLTRIMCKAMNRSLANVLFGGMGAKVAATDDAEIGKVTSWTVEDVAFCLDNSMRVAIVPGYGMAVAQAQHVVRELMDVLEERGVTVQFGIHEVAGRMPGHMNVLLAEAEVPYEKLCDRETINPQFEQTDAVLVIGANDVVNPAARNDQTSPIYGMPILDVDKAHTVIVCKRSLNPGFAGISNALFYNDNTAMLFGDAKKSIADLVTALQHG